MVDKPRRGRHHRPVQAERTFAAELAALEDAGLRRRLRTLAGPPDAEVTVDGRRLLHLASNNYLGLASDPRLCAAATAAMERWGCGTGASRLITGHTELHATNDKELI